MSVSTNNPISQNSIDFRFPWKGFILLYGVYFVLVQLFYFAPMPFRYIGVVLLLLLFMRGKQDYWWLSLFFLINSGIWGLFSEGVRGASTGMPLLTLGPGASFTFNQLFVIIALGKGIYYRRPFQSVFNKPIVWLMIYIGFLLILAIIMGTSFGTVFDTLKSAIFWAFYFIYPALILSKNNIFRFAYLLFPAVILVFIDSLFFMFTNGYYMNSLFNPDYEYVSSQVLRFLMPGWHLVLYTFIFSLAMVHLHRKHAFFLYLIAGLAFWIELVSATRSWFVIFSIILAYSLFSEGRSKALLYIGGVLLIGFFYIVPSSQVASKIFKGTTERLFTVFEIGQEGSFADESIDSKIEVRLPVQLDLIKQNPLTGWGFTGKGGDPDVGIFGHLSEMGIIGVGLFIWLWIKHLKLTRQISKERRIPKAYRQVNGVLWISLIGLLISHFTTNQIFGVTYYVSFLAVFFWLSDFFIRQAFLKTDTNEET